MRKPHWELLQQGLELPLVDYTDSMVAAFQKVASKLGVHSHEFQAQHLDCFQRDLQPHAPKEYFGANSDSPVSALRAALFYALFRKSGSRIYKIGNDFAEILQDIKLTPHARHLPPDDGVICIEFPDDMKAVLKNGEIATCAYLSCVADIGKDSIGHVVRRLEIHVPFGKSLFDRMILHFHEAEDTIDQSLALIEGRGMGTNIPRKLLDFIINTYLYIHSGDPDLRDYRPPKRPLSQKVKAQRRYDKEMADKSAVPLTLVGFEWKKERIYTVAGTTVRPHPQAYWCGKGRVRMEIIFKPASTRTYKNVKPESK